MASLLEHTVMPSGGDYTSLDACIDHLVASHADLVSANVYAEVKIDGTWSAVDTTAVALGGLTTSASCYLKVYTTTTARHNGTFGSGSGNGYYCLKHSTWDTDHIQFGSNYCTVDGIAIDASTGGYRGRGIVIHGYGDCQYFTVKNCIIKGVHGNGTDGATGIKVDWVTNTTSYIYNNIIYAKTGTAPADGMSVYGNTIYVYNNTVYSLNIGFSINEENSSIHLKNNVAIGCTTDFSSDSTDADYNLSSDDTAPGAHSKKSSNLDPDASLTTEFVSATDLHLISSANCVGNGVDLSAIFTTDIDGDTRPTGAGTWDIGADEYVSTGDASKDYSRGDEDTLPSGTADLENLFTSGEYTSVGSDDADRVAQTAG